MNPCQPRGEAGCQHEAPAKLSVPLGRRPAAGSPKTLDREAQTPAVPVASKLIRLRHIAGERSRSFQLGQEIGLKPQVPH